MTTRRTLTALTATLLLAGTACSVDAYRSVSAEELEKKVQEQAAQAQMPPGATVDCADDLKAEVDATTKCWWSYADDQKMPDGSDMPDGTRLGTVVTVSSVKDGDAQLRIQNDNFLTLADGSQLTLDGRTSSPEGTTAPTDGDTAGTAKAASMPKDQVEAKVTEALGSKMPPGSTVECPDDLVGETGATTRCWWSYAPGLKLPNGSTMPDGTKIGTTVVVSSIAGDDLELRATNDTFLTMSDGSTKAPEELTP